MYKSCATSKAIQFCSEQLEMLKWRFSGDIINETFDNPALALGLARAR
jgi:hypothetical protein